LVDFRALWAHSRRVLWFTESIIERLQPVAGIVVRLDEAVETRRLSVCNRSVSPGTTAVTW
jgi:hypothetical protein